MERFIYLSEGIADGGADAAGVIRTEVSIVVDPVETSLGANEETSVDIELDASAEIDVEVVAGGDQLTATARRTTQGTGRVMGVERAEASDKLQVRGGGDLRRVHGVEVVKHGPIVDARIEAAN